MAFHASFAANAATRILLEPHPNLYWPRATETIKNLNTISNNNKLYSVKERNILQKHSMYENLPALATIFKTYRKTVRICRLYGLNHANWHLDARCSMHIHTCRQKCRIRPQKTITENLRINIKSCRGQQKKKKKNREANNLLNASTCTPKK